MNTVVKDNRLTHKRIRVRIPKHYHQEPIISHLISHYHLTINILAAILGSNANGASWEGWFDLELRGATSYIEDALIYLQELNLDIWQDTDTDGW